MTVYWYGTPKKSYEGESQLSKGGRNIGYFLDYPQLVGDKLLTPVMLVENKLKVKNKKLVVIKKENLTLANSKAAR